MNIFLLRFHVFVRRGWFRFDVLFVFYGKFPFRLIAFCRFVALLFITYFITLMNFTFELFGWMFCEFLTIKVLFYCAKLIYLLISFLISVLTSFFNLKQIVLPFSICFLNFYKALWLWWNLLTFTKACWPFSKLLTESTQALLLTDELLRTFEWKFDVIR